jgi:hypothetical protein
VTTHGPGSPVNVGSGTLNQQIKTAEGMGELVVALTTLLDAMKDRPELSEVREIVIEAKHEAAKPVPNRLKLRSILGGAKDGLQGIGDELNGINGETVINRTAAARLKWPEGFTAASWLHETALRLYPDSQCAKEHSG